MSSWHLLGLPVWGLPHKNDKVRKPPAPDRRCEILDGLVEKAPLTLTSEVVERCIASDHILDGLICAMIARASELDATHRPPDPKLTSFDERAGLSFRSLDR